MSPVSAAPAAAPFESARTAPGPRPWPFGSLLGIQTQGLLQYLAQGWRRYGDVYRVRLGAWRAVVLAHPAALKHVLAVRRDNYVKAETYDGVRRVVGNGLLALEGDAWKKRRALVQPAFHKQALAKLATAMVESGAIGFDALARRAEGRTLVVDAHREMVGLTLDVVVRALFGPELTQVAQVSYEALESAMQLVSEYSNRVVLPPWVPTPANRRFYRTMREVEGAVYRVIEAGRARGAGDGTLLSMLLESRDAGGVPLSDRDLRDEIFTLFVAGHETTALTLTWLFVLLAGRADLWAEARREVDAVLGPRAPGFDDVPRLVFLRQLIDETLRLSGPVAMVARTAVEADVVGGFRVDAGDVVLPFFWATHRHPDFWTEPESFDPSRFSPERSKGRDPWSYLPFSAGQRMCIGNTFSLVETVLLLAMLLQRFEVRVPEGQRVEPRMMVTVRPSRPVLVELAPRSQERASCSGPPACG